MRTGFRNMNFRYPSFQLQTNKENQYVYIYLSIPYWTPQCSQIFMLLNTIQSSGVRLFSRHLNWCHNLRPQGSSHNQDALCVAWQIQMLLTTVISNQSRDLSPDWFINQQTYWCWLVTCWLPTPVIWETWWSIYYIYSRCYWNCWRTHIHLHRDISTKLTPHSTLLRQGVGDVT